VRDIGCAAAVEAQNNARTVSRLNIEGAYKPHVGFEALVSRTGRISPAFLGKQQSAVGW